jgi:hypothetical protein
MSPIGRKRDPSEQRGASFGGAATALGAAATRGTAAPGGTPGNGTGAQQEEGAPGPAGAESGTTTADSTQTGQSLLPTLTVPRGGGAIRGIGEKFSVNAATGTTSLTVPMAASPGRNGFGPAVELSYDSGNGNGPFGLGFQLSVPRITRKTDQGLPRYHDADETDTFLLSGAEDLVPLRDEAGAIVETMRELDGVSYRVRRYRPRVEGLFARIERWIHAGNGDAHWRVTTPDNTTHRYGTAVSRRTRAATGPPARLARRAETKMTKSEERAVGAALPEAIPVKLAIEVADVLDRFASLAPAKEHLVRCAALGRRLPW